MRIAISCLAFPLIGRPTRRARRSSSPVDSGMSERSSRLSGIGFALLAGRLPCADDANCFFAIFQPPQRVRNDQDPPGEGSSEAFRPSLEFGMLRVVPIEGFRVTENAGGLFKGHAVLLEVAQGFSSIPREHIYVYTLIRGIWEGLRNDPNKGKVRQTCERTARFGSATEARAASMTSRPSSNCSSVTTSGTRMRMTLLNVPAVMVMRPCSQQ